MAKRIDKNEITSTAPLWEFSEEDARLSVVKGNSKIGKTIYSISTLPGDTEHLLRLKDGRLLTTTPGTCSGNCATCFDSGCYAVNSARRYYNTVIPAWAGNTLLLRSGRLFSEVKKFIDLKNAGEEKKITMFRINVSGEITCAEDLHEWNEIAKAHPEIQFGLYTKNYDALEAFLKKDGKPVKNFVINVSQWHGVADEFLARHPGEFNVFEYDDSNKTGKASRGRHCPAVKKNGKRAIKKDGKPVTCDGCTYCYKQTGKVTKVYAH